MSKTKSRSAALAAAALLVIAIVAGCASETDVPAGADINDPSKPATGTKSTAPPSTSPGPAANEAEGRAMLERANKGGH